jgi:hypothetical protein
MAREIAMNITTGQNIAVMKPPAQESGIGYQDSGLI